MKLLVSSLALLPLFSLPSSAFSQTTAPAAALSAAPTREALVELAFDAVSAMPEVPHARNRCRAQESIAQAAIEMDLCAQAERIALAVTDWRKAQALADIALQHARKGRVDEAKRVLALAEGSTVPGTQEWHDERVRSHLAAAHHWLGDDAAVARLTQGVGEAEIGSVQVVVAARSSIEQFDGRLELLRSTVKNGGFDALKCSLETAVELHRVAAADATRREQIETLVKSSWEKLPLDVRTALLRRLAENYLASGDRAGAVRELDEAQALVDNNRWLPEDHIAQVALIARLRHAAGEAERARRDIAGVLGLFERERDKIVDIYRAGALRAVAESQQAMGDSAAALHTFARAVEEGVANPNSRPRADDLAATLCALARSGASPDEALFARLKQVRAALGDPW